MRGGGTSGYLQRQWDAEARRARAAWVLASDLASDVKGGDMRQVVARDGGGPGRTVDDLTARCRKVACYLAVVVADVSPPHLAAVSGLHRKTITLHCGWVEDARDRPEFDAMIRRLHRTLVGMCAHIVIANLDELDGEEGE